jgi:subtilase family serine protease
MQDAASAGRTESVTHAQSPREGELHVNRFSRRWLLVVALAVFVAAMLAVSGTSGRSAAARAGIKTPASGAAVLHKRLGQPLANANGTVQFGCQLTTPAFCYGPDQIRAAYGIQPLLDRRLDGRGRTIAIIDAFGSPTIADDLAAFNDLWGLPAADLKVVTPFGVAPTDPDNATGWAIETSLDVQWAHVVAPGAKILLVVSRSDDDSDILDATQWVLDHNAGDVLSQSYGEAEQCLDPAVADRQHKLFKRLNQRDITLIASSADQGSAQFTCDGNAYFKAVSSPASDPYVTGIGGTELTADGVTGAYQSETTWNESDVFEDAVAGGGGLSVVYSRPSYQTGFVRDRMRGVPDVSYNAGVYTGVIVVAGGEYWLIGGTSAGSPQWAGLVAIADQLGHGRVGSINKPLYTIGRLGKVSSQFLRDIADHSTNAIPDLSQFPDVTPLPGTPVSGYTAEKGYDLATGLGTPIANTLVPWLAAHADRGDEGNGWGSKSQGYPHDGRYHGHKHDN